MGLFTPAVWRLVALFYHCFDHIVIHGYLTGCVTARQVVGVLVITKDTLSQRTDGYQEARRAEKGVRKDAYEFGRPTAHDIPEVFGTRLQPQASGQAFTIINQITCGNHVEFSCSISGARFNVISSGRSAF
jgi:hypothetical protein